MACFAALMLLVAGLLVARQMRHRWRPDRDRPVLDDPILVLRPVLRCRCQRAAALLVAASLVGLLTGFLGVGGGFLVVPALLLTLDMPIEQAAGTSLVVITLTSVVALAARTGAVTTPDWGVVAALTASSAVAAALGARLADRLDPRRLQRAFTALVLTVALTTAALAVPALV
jgi:uncharacterized membrane protein YfcA